MKKNLVNMVRLDRPNLHGRIYPAKEFLSQDNVERVKTGVMLVTIGDQLGPLTPLDNVVGFVHSMSRADDAVFIEWKPTQHNPLYNELEKAGVKFAILPVGTGHVNDNVVSEYILHSFNLVPIHQIE